MSNTDIPPVRIADAKVREPKSAEFKTPLKRVRHFGAAGHGVEHFIQQKASALGLIVLVPLFVGNFALAARGGSDSLVEWLGSPVGALVSLLFFGCACFHMRIGMATIVEDYLDGAGRYVCLLANTFFCVVLWAVVSLSILLLAFGS